MSSLLSYFDSGREPRDCQVQALNTIEANWDKADVFVVDAPVGSGKSGIATAVARWAAAAPRSLKSLILTPNNVLLQQYVAGNPRAASLMGKANYVCKRGSTSVCQVACGDKGSGIVTSVGKRGGVKTKHCTECPYTAAQRKLYAVPWGITNYHVYLARGLYRDVIVADEAHNLLPLIREMAARTLWQHEYAFPSSLRSYTDLTKWLDQQAKRDAPNPMLMHLRKELLSGEPRWLVERARELYRGTPKECLKLLPVDTSREPPLLWPKAVRKLVLMSGTISPKDLEQMGLSKRRVCWIATQSPIPAKQRPVVLHKPGFDLSFGAAEQDLDAAASYIRKLASQHPEERGLVHVTYGLMEALQRRLGEALGARLLTHTRENKKEVYQAFLKSPTGTVFLCAGLYEGIDLPGDLGRWQVITKVPFASLAEPAWAWLAQTDEERYAWEALRIVLQGTGRVCRGPGDFGVTYIIDRAFHKLPKHLFPPWFCDSLEAGEML